LAADYEQLRNNLRAFYDFTGKVVLFIGAGGKQLFDPAVETNKLIVIDKDFGALQELKARVSANGKQDSIQVIAGSFEEITFLGDVVYFEFCLHEMAEPERALAHARTLAPEVVVFDHLPGSEWTYYAAEEDKVRRSAEAVEREGVRRRQTFAAEQRFRDFDELIAKISVQGPLAIERAQRFAGAANIVIPMTYALTLL